jgi:hypothetical protein
MDRLKWLALPLEKRLESLRHLMAHYRWALGEYKRQARAGVPAEDLGKFRRIVVEAAVTEWRAIERAENEPRPHAVGGGSYRTVRPRCRYDAPCASMCAELSRTVDCVHESHTGVQSRREGLKRGAEQRRETRM